MTTNWIPDVTITRTTPLDLLAPARELRQGCNELAFKISTGEDPESTPGWQRTTTLDDYDDLDAIGKAAARVMPAGVGAVFAGMVLDASWMFTALTVAPRWVWLLGAYLVLTWVVWVSYDLFWGIVELAGWLRRRNES